MFQQRIQPIAPSDTTHYLVNASGDLVWFEPDFGQPTIMAANTSDDRRNVADFVWGCLHLGITVHGVSPGHLADVALTGGDRLKGFRWVHHSEVQLPEIDNPPAPGLIIVPGNGKNRYEDLATVTETAVAVHGVPTDEAHRERILTAIMQRGNCSAPTAKKHLERYLAGQSADSRGGKRPGAGRPKREES